MNKLPGENKIHQANVSAIINKLKPVIVIFAIAFIAISCIIYFSKKPGNTSITSPGASPLMIH